MAVSDILMTPLQAVWRIISEVSVYVEGWGDWKIRPYHQQAIDAVLTHLDFETAGKVRTQLEQKYFMQFMSDGRINRIFFNKMPDHLLISDSAFVDRLYKVEMFVDSKKQTVHVVFYECCIFAVEFKKPHKFFIGKEIKIGSVTPGKPKDTFTAVIDRAAHGTEADDNP